MSDDKPTFMFLGPGMDAPVHGSSFRDIAETNALRFLAVEIRELLQRLRDPGTIVDSGSKGQTADVSAVISGVKFVITIEQS